MPLIAKITGVGQVVSALGKKKSSPERVEYIVGYTQNYGLYVHERLDLNHPNGGQAKFLEQPAREYRRQIINVIKNSYVTLQDLSKAMAFGALYLQKLSMKLVPVDTGALRASAFTRKL